ncbi:MULTISPECIES: hypothetical protein [Mycobacteriaceae]|uniref:hypothetical protein n=1 Tax=Mycobacteriaceae TaxID=1762 RepID=UPI000800AC26|nr:MULTISPECIES: hypothetical protein [Mycobacteriaceae]MCK0176635.1 hypothetical protein [Mycolicibacterium sp. F2034L]OBB55984.1 hypothetical protein A5757_02785 [Mycobacterium sp. 852013-51886_SCH5428379]
MPLRKRTSSVLDGAGAETPAHEPDIADIDDALARAEEAEAEAAEAEAIASAARARARAIRLRREAQAAIAGKPESETPADGDALTEADAAEAEHVEDDDIDADDTPGAEAPEVHPVAADAPTRRSGRRVPWKAIGYGVAAVLTIASVVVSVLMVLNHREVQAEQQRANEYAAAARQGVVTLMSLNFNTAKDDVQRIIDNAAGKFREDFEASAEDFTTVAERSKVITEANVNATAVQSMTDDSAVVLVAATSRITNETGAEQDPRTWRLIVNVVREGDRIKLSNVEFAP